MTANLESLAAELEASSCYRVLRRLEPRTAIEAAPDGVDLRVAAFVDVETTGLDPSVDEIIELAIVPFSYSPTDGRIFEVGAPFERFRQPSKPIPPAMTAIHGITDEMVAGAVIDPVEVASVIAGCAPIIAHHAGFDRPFVERLVPEFAALPWACSMSQVDWGSAGYEGSNLAYLAMGAGFFYDRHRAVSDCLAGIELLARPLRPGEAPAMFQLLDTGRKPGWRIWAEGSPFQAKDTLKARGYRWNADRKCWWFDVEGDDPAPEIEYLRTAIYRRGVELPVQKITAFNRFSGRVG